MAAKLIKDLGRYKTLWRDSRTGLAWVDNGSTGTRHTCHANIDRTGSVAGMKKLGYWASDAVTVRCAGGIYNLDTMVISDELDQIAADACRCIRCASQWQGEALSQEGD